MSKKFFVCAFIFVLPFSVLSAQSRLEKSIQEGRVLPFDEGVTFDYGDSWTVRLFIHNSQLVAVFLDSQRKVRTPEGIDLVTVDTRSVYRKGEFYPYHLRAVDGGLYYTSTRHVYRPHKYNVEVHLKKATWNFKRYRMRPIDDRYNRIALGAKLLDQTNTVIRSADRMRPTRPGEKKS